MKKRRWLMATVSLTLSIFLSESAWAQTATTSGSFVTEPPTLVSLGFEWKITGDTNRNARVDVTYRQKGDQEWHHGLPLMRLQNEQIGTPPAPANPAAAAAAFEAFAHGTGTNYQHYDTFVAS